MKTIETMSLTDYIKTNLKPTQTKDAFDFCNANCRMIPYYSWKSRAGHIVNDGDIYCTQYANDIYGDHLECGEAADHLSNTDCTQCALFDDMKETRDYDLCDSKCIMTEDAKIDIESGNRYCTQWASKHGWCGKTAAHMGNGGVDCRRCADLDINA